MIQVKQLNVDYFGHKALTDVDLEIPMGFSEGIIGPNGAGKSTLMKAMLGIIPSQGQVHYMGKDIRENLRKIAYVPQKNELDLTFPITVEDTVLTGTYPKLQLFKRPGKNEREIVDLCLEQVSIQDLRKKQISNLSGGQLQRVFIARALAQQADVFFLDEPFVGIDLKSETIIVDILRKLRSEGKTILVVHHDLHEVESYFDRLLILNKKVVAEGTVKEVFTNKNIQEAYGGSLGNIQIKGLGD
ncbi:metal ABC transporter ATP-binding protein [Facklamia miroungae]|uniref:Iron/zinc/copper transport system ATP-binding protein n=1 Tax=Facklamia miroungae TaxID=120956 RepID=A0A1G7QI28_9LACT|nr:metal ABC transporter ATP-binding protein [Facklamia miroungae]NKZ28949.1 metal ABC transporter ATP-binding protein [Facklamia miroungae]SDF98161.1 iron/zinc/copper transport system ATP-binding protein [Facklamia miroungae]